MAHLRSVSAPPTTTTAQPPRWIALIEGDEGAVPSERRFPPAVSRRLAGCDGLHCQITPGLICKNAQRAEGLGECLAVRLNCNQYRMPCSGRQRARVSDAVLRSPDQLAGRAFGWRILYFGEERGSADSMDVSDESANTTAGQRTGGNVWTSSRATFNPIVRVRFPGGPLRSPHRGTKGEAMKTRGGTVLAIIATALGSSEIGATRSPHHGARGPRSRRPRRTRR